MKAQRVNLSNMPNMGETINIKALNEEDAKTLISIGGVPGYVESVSGLQDVKFPISRITAGNVWMGFDSPQNGYNEFIIDGVIYAKVYLGRYASVIEDLT